MTTDPAGWPPKNPANVPELAAQKHVLSSMLNLVLRGRGLMGLPGQALQANLLRLVDKATEAYERGRRELLEYATTDNQTMSPLFRAVDAFEDCIISAHRSMLYVGGLKKLTPTPALDWSVLPQAPDLERLRSMRNRIEHTDEDIVESRHGQGVPGNAAMLLVMDDRVELGANSITYDELSGWLEGLNALAKELSDYDPAQHSRR